MQWSWYKAVLGFKEQQEGQCGQSRRSEAEDVERGGWIGRETMLALAES